jgi:hypothetical protein
LVIGPDYKQQLAPYDESLKAEPHRVDVSIKELQQMLEHYSQKLPGPKTQVGRAIRHAYGEQLPITIVDGRVEIPTHSILRQLFQQWADVELLRDDRGYYRYSTYNEQSRWDWYQIGGRWTGYFKLKPGRNGHLGEPGLMTEPPNVGWVDVCRKGDVDLEAMRNEAGKKAGADWDAIHDVMAKVNQRAAFKTWKQVCDKFKVEKATDDTAITKARTFYHAQPIVKALNEHLSPFGTLDDVITSSREAWVQQARDGALTSYAVVKDGQWYERGKMGWWGIATNEDPEQLWNQKFAELFDALPDDTELTLVDAHI